MLSRVQRWSDRFPAALYRCGVLLVADCLRVRNSFVREAIDSLPSRRKAMASSPQNKAKYSSPAVPEHVPSIKELKLALPGHCFRPELARSMIYVLKDLVISASLYTLILLVEVYELPLICQWLVFPVYWFLQGTMMWAMFVLAHDCGHGSFSNYTWVNDIVGNILNSLILVPYYPWKLSHQHHHKNTGNIDKDEIFYPIREKDSNGGKPYIKYFGLGIGWMHYLMFGYNPRKVSHFNPMNPMFVRQAVKCAISLACNAAWIVVLVTYYHNYGFSCLLNHYVIPVIVFASWLCITTFLHHHDDDVPWYADDKWDYVRGQLSSVDRDYGWAHSLVHNIGTHQMHHMFTKIPHYHLEEATAAFRKKYPELVRISNASIIPEFIRRFNIFEKDLIISNDKDVHVFGGESFKKK